MSSSARHRTIGGMTADEFVAELYRGLLGREPDPSSTGKVDRLAAGASSAEEIVAEFIRSDEYRSLSREPTRFLNDQSQFGELELLLKHWVKRLVRQPAWVVDVGARGKERSNSYDLLKTFGWRGLLIEANPRLVPIIRQEFEGVDCLVVQCAVSDYDGQATFFIGTNDDVSSLNSAASANWGTILGQVEVPVRRLGSILDEQGIPNDFALLSIDIEGEDVKVLNDVVDSGYRPGWVIIEASLDFSVRSLFDLPFNDEVRRCYSVVGQTRANLILEHIGQAPNRPDHRASSSKT